jgi:hypothetical protein
MYAWNLYQYETVGLKVYKEMANMIIHTHFVFYQIRGIS